MEPGDETEPRIPPTVVPSPTLGVPGVGDGAPSTERSGPGAPAEVGPGSLLFGRHRLIRKLGAGGMGDVWLVEIEGLGCERALKRIVSGIAAEPHARARFRSEARTMAAISHPNVVVFHDASLGDDGSDAYIEMEYVPGEPLDRVLAAGSAMPPDWTVRIARQLCDALGAVHARGIVHRDLKPSNLMLLGGRPAGREWLKVLDFGIAKTLMVEGDAATITRGFIGSYPYASPEQIEGTAGVIGVWKSPGL